MRKKISDLLFLRSMWLQNKDTVFNRPLHKLT